MMLTLGIARTPVTQRSAGAYADDNGTDVTGRGQSAPDVLESGTVPISPRSMLATLGITPEQQQRVARLARRVPKLLTESCTGRGRVRAAEKDDHLGSGAVAV